MGTPGGEDEGEAGDLAPGITEEDDPMNPAAWYAEPDVCGSCIAWSPRDPKPGEEVASGVCKLRAELNRVPATLKKCTIYKPRGTFRYDPNRSPEPSKRKRASTLRVLRRSADGEMVAAKAPPRTSAPAILRREKDIEHEYEASIPGLDDVVVEGDRGPRPERPVVVVPKTIDLGGEDEGAAAVRASLVDLVRKEHGRSSREIHSKYRTGGRVIARVDGKENEMTAERFFFMLDRFRASLDAMEKKVEKTTSLAEDKDELVAQLKRMQGSFTTFNLLFADKADYFSGKE
jgi:hypothetical protein